MGNGSSQSIVLGPPRLQASFPVRGAWQRGAPKFAHPQNRVLPKPVAGQRLRSTDNGSMLQAAGTIRGHGRREADGSAEGTLADVLRRRTSEMAAAEEGSYVRGHRLFHSDPDIARRQPPEAPFGVGRRPGGGAAAARASKLKCKKKARAPEPPGGASPTRGPDCRCSKSRAPQPLAVVVHPPPPPPPLPVTTRTSAGGDESSRSPSVTRSVETRGYEKNVHPLEKWRNYHRSAGDVRLDERDELPHGSRTTIFDSSRQLPAQPPTHLPQRPDPFQAEIQAVTRKIAETRSPDGGAPPAAKQNTSSPPKFYFADTGVFKTGNANTKNDSTAAPKPPMGRQSADSPQDCTTLDEVVPSLQRFSPARRRYRSPARPHNAQRDWEDLSRNLCSKVQDTGIDVRLRPVLPRKPPEMPKFSPSEAWQALGSDGLGSSNQSTSDDGPPEPVYKGGRRFFKARSLSDSHWTPIQDLLDDSDVSSDDSEEAVVPRIRPEIPTRFSLPTVMFSNMRPIGCETKTNLSYDNVKTKQQQPKKYSNEPPDHGFRKFLGKRNKYLSEEDIAASDSNWTFGQYGLQKRGKQYSSELMLSDKKKTELMRKSHFSDFLGDILMSKANHMRTQMKSSDSGNSNFSFYSTEGQIMFLPEKEGLAKEAECSPPSRGRVYDIRRKFEEPKKPSYWGKAGSKKPNPADLALGRKRDLELAKMLEDEVRRRRNKEKISIRQQLQRMKSLQSEDDDQDDLEDEAYFTEPKSREESGSPFFAAGLQGRFLGSEIGLQPSRLLDGASRLSHWQSSPALLGDGIAKNGVRPAFKGRPSSSSLVSSPDPEAWLRDCDGRRAAATVTDTANDGDVSSSPTPKKERRRTDVYEQLMDIVRKEERHLQKAQQAEPRSPESSQRESSPSSCSESSSTSSYSYSESSSGCKGGVPANREFRGYSKPPAMPSFQVAFVQPYSPSKSYRPVPFDLPLAAPGYRLRDLQEERKQVQAEAS